MSKRETLEEFIEKARKIHGDKYDYSLVSLNGNQVKVDIVCPFHGVFQQTPGHHKDGKGCKKCATKENSEKCREVYSDYVKEVFAIHSGKYEYSPLSENSYRPLRIDLKCPEHGWFQMNHSDHKQGKGCSKCAINGRADNRRKSLQQFIDSAREVHGDRYEYSLVEFKGNNIKVSIKCHLHGVFEMTPAAHVLGKQNCPHCANIARQLSRLESTEEFIEKAKLVHGDRYDYSLVNKTKSDLYNVPIICRVHGVFKQTANNHKSGKGCPSCGISGYDQNKPGTFYILKTGSLTKVGITNRKASSRIRSINRTSGENFELHTHIKSEDGSFIYDLEQRILKWLKSIYNNVDSRFDGYTECFVNVDIDKLLQFISN